MLDLRYHVASLSAVFLALVVGILVRHWHFGARFRRQVGDGATSRTGSLRFKLEPIS